MPRESAVSLNFVVKVSLPYQLDVSKGLDNIAVTPTGSGKTGYLFITILVMIAIAKTCPAVKFPADAAILSCYMSHELHRTADGGAARRWGENLWMKAREGISMLILCSEQLISEGFLAFEAFYNRVYILGVDEIHLLVQWGLTFCKAFSQIGFMLLLPPFLPIPKFRMQFSLYAGVNLGIQMLFRELHSGIDGGFFPEIAWVLANRDKPIICCVTINLVFHVKAYLNTLLPANSDRDFRIRTHTGLNWPDDKAQTLSNIINNPDCQIIIATNGLAQCNDIRVIKTVIQIGEPECVEILSLQCTPEIRNHELYQPPPKRMKVHSHIPVGQRSTKLMKEAGRSRLEELRFSSHPPCQIPSFPNPRPYKFCQNCKKIVTLVDLVPFISRIAVLVGHHSLLFDVLLGLRETFWKMKSNLKAGTKK
ncbi:hypothetical protein GGX14DRAFT_402632 [Mycena pura]|uniref:Helicase ATP-binding domain-containing protein n=1 Tax=Mycena pura TaxID=153505 RepID=A0AAD6UYD3_9AGAR|nr:hypothetical protein GGX14DRAFT_402632 [Mycena pura]